LSSVEGAKRQTDVRKCLRFELPWTKNLRLWGNPSPIQARPTHKQDTEREVQLQRSLINTISHSLPPHASFTSKNRTMKGSASTLALLFAVQASSALAAGTSNYYKAEWIEAHNKRRAKFHAANGKSVVNLKWSNGLADLAKTWAEENALQCKNRQGEDDGYGRNGIMRQGTTEGLSPEWALANWEAKKTLGFPNNGAITQAIWRPTQYVGCYTAVNKEKNCSAGVCYYAKPGNCNMGGTYGTTLEARNKWREVTFADNSLCTPEFPPELSAGSKPMKKPTKKPAKKPTKKPTKGMM